MIDEILSALITAEKPLYALAGAALQMILAYAYKVYEAKQLGVVESTIKANQEIYQYLTSLIHESKAARIMVMRLSNGGTIPRVGVPLYTYPVYEIYHSPLASGLGAWKDRFVDACLLHHLLALNVDKSHIILKETLEPGKPLTDIFETQKIKCSVLYELFQEEHTYYYIQLDYLTDKIEENPRTRELISGTIRAIKHLFIQDRQTKKLLGVK
jgi:hypothetical protein